MKTSPEMVTSLPESPSTGTVLTTITDESSPTPHIMTTSPNIPNQTSGTPFTTPAMTTSCNISSQTTDTSLTTAVLTTETTSEVSSPTTSTPSTMTALMTTSHNISTQTTDAPSTTTFLTTYTTPNITNTSPDISTQTTGSASTTALLTTYTTPYTPTTTPVPMTTSDISTQTTDAPSTTAFLTTYTTPNIMNTTPDLSTQTRDALSTSTFLPTYTTPNTSSPTTASASTTAFPTTYTTPNITDTTPNISSQTTDTPLTTPVLTTITTEASSPTPHIPTTTTVLLTTTPKISSPTTGSASTTAFPTTYTTPNITDTTPNISSQTTDTPLTTPVLTTITTEASSPTPHITTTTPVLLTTTPKISSPTTGSASTTAFLTTYATANISTQTTETPSTTAVLTTKTTTEASTPTPHIPTTTTALMTTSPETSGLTSDAPSTTSVWTTNTSPEISSPTPEIPITTTVYMTSSPEMSSPTPDTPFATSSITSSTTKAPLNCSNGGELLNGVCICPDEWTGETCTIENFCKENNLENFTFPRTVIGWSAYSKQTCENGTGNAGISKATARCLNNTANRPPMFAQLRRMECGVTLEELLGNVSGRLTSVGHITEEELATSTQMLTSKPEALTSSNITVAADIVIILANSIKITKDTATSAVTTVSQLLSADPKLYSEIKDDTIVRLTKSIEELSMKPKDGLSQVVQPKLVIQTTQVKQSKGVQFRALSGDSSSNFTANRIQVDDNTSEMTESEIPSEVEIFIKLPSARSQPNKEMTVGFALYDNNAFFQPRGIKSLPGTSSRVISGSVHGVDGAKPEYVDLRFRPMNDTDKVLEHFECVYWDYNGSHWSTVGCQRVGTNLSSLQCRCNHTTNFAVLMSFRAIGKEVSAALNWIGILGCTASILGLSITLVYQIVTRKARRNAPTVLFACLCASMIIYNLTFVVGIDQTDSEVDGAQSSRHLDSRNEQRDKGPCTVVTVLLQYFLLATFSFNTLYAADLLLVLRMTLTKRRRSGHFTTIYMLLGWGFPAVMVAISLAVSYRVHEPLGYRRKDVCWLAAADEDSKFDFSKPMLWGFLVPMSTMLLFNTAVLIYFAFLSFRQPIVNSSKNAALKKKLLSNFSLGVVLGLTWVLGYLVLASSHAEGLHIFLNFAFSLLVSTQGVQIFILFTARSTLFRKTTSRAVKSISKMSLHRNRYNLNTKKNSVTTDQADDAYGTFTGICESSV
ncbi:hypothetical protein ACEWY4_016362 [Coilia grayii]|uniref:Uncharacterized protein n=1 Tax=Coilia grayii TaxID=363190 RepID=A0ABD1JL63_9TELE